MFGTIASFALTARMSPAGRQGPRTFGAAERVKERVKEKKMFGTRVRCIDTMLDMTIPRSSRPRAPPWNDAGHGFELFGGVGDAELGAEWLGGISSAALR